MFKIVLLGIFIILLAFFLLVLFIYLKYMGKKGMVENQLKELNMIKLSKLTDFSLHNPYQFEGNYYKAQLHTHTTRSDGKLEPEELVKEYKEAGYTFVAITDHDKITEYRDFDDNSFITITGEEMTQPEPFWPLGHHISRLFVKEVTAKGALNERLNFTINQGGIVVINHPGTISGLGTQRWMPIELKGLDKFYLIEIVNHFSETEMNIKYWHGLLKHFGPERPIWGIASDDTHRIEDIDKDWIMVKVDEISEEGLKRALKRGSFYATQGPEIYFGADKKTVYANSEREMKLIFIDSDHNICKRVKGIESSYVVQGHEGFIRVEAIDPTSGKKAWSQPFWLLER